MPPHQPSPTIAPTPFLDPPPFDPLKEEKKERDANPTAPIFPAFNPTETPKLPTIPDLSPTPPPFEPTKPQTPEQRLNDRGIFPAKKADVTATISGSPLVPDKEIGGDPVRIHPFTPIPSKTKPKTDPLEEYKDSLAPLAPLALIPPLIFTRPTGPKGTIDPQTADDITKSKEPPKPPTGTKQKCQNGCMAGLETGQEAILDKLGKGVNFGLNAADLALLNTINSKMGDQLPGGLAGKLTRLSQWLHLDRALNLLTYVNTLHNAYMLSNGLSQTLFSMVSNVLAAVGIKDAENNPLDIAAIVGKSVDAYAKSVLGVSTVDGIKAEWKKYNRIYQAAANLLSAFQSIGQSILGAMEVIGSMVGKIGNAMRKWGVVGEKAFGWMNNTPNYQSPFFIALEKVETITSNIDSIASSVLSGQDSVTQLQTQKAELDKSLKQDEGSKQGKESAEAAKVKTNEEKAKTDSKPPTISPTAERKPES